MSSAKPGRNAPCPCGSGKKYKVCHAAEDRARASARATVTTPPNLQAAMALLGDAPASPEAREALRKAHAGDVDALVQYVLANPQLAQRVAQEARERAARVEARLREPSTPALFAPEEELWLTVALWEPLRAMKEPGEDPSTRREAVNRLLQAVKDALEPDLLAGLLERLRTRSRDSSLDESTRAFFADAAIAIEAEPVRMVMASLFTARQEAQGRSAEEMVMLADLRAKTVWTPEDFEPYRQLLEAQGLSAAAARLGKAQERLRARPLSVEGPVGSTTEA